MVSIRKETLVIERTRLSNVFRFPTNMISPSMKYAYNACNVVNTMYLHGHGQNNIISTGISYWNAIVQYCAQAHLGHATKTQASCAFDVFG